MLVKSDFFSVHRWVSPGDVHGNGLTVQEISNLTPGRTLMSASLSIHYTGTI